MILTNTPREIFVFQNSLYHRFFRFLSILEVMLASKNLSKIHQKSIKNLSKKSLNIGYLFLSIFSRFWRHLGPQVEAMLGLCWLKNPIKQHFKKNSKKTFKKHSRPSRACPEAPGLMGVDALNNQNYPHYITTYQTE